MCGQDTLREQYHRRCCLLSDTRPPSLCSTLSWFTVLCTVLVLVLTPCNGPGQCGGGGGRGGASGRAVSWARQNNNSGSALSSACLVRVRWIVQEALVVIVLLPVYPHSTLHPCGSYWSYPAICNCECSRSRCRHNPPGS